MGKYHIPTLNGCHNFLCIVDDFSRADWVFLLRDKTEAYDRIVQFLFHSEKTIWFDGSKGV